MSERRKYPICVTCGERVGHFPILHIDGWRDYCEPCYLKAPDWTNAPLEDLPPVAQARIGKARRDVVGGKTARIRRLVQAGTETVGQFRACP